MSIPRLFANGRLSAPCRAGRHVPRYSACLVKSFSSAGALSEKAQRKRRSRGTSLSSDELPSRRGAALSSWDSVTGITIASPVVPASPSLLQPASSVPLQRDYDAETLQAIKRGLLPDTPLSRGVYKNVLRFPECIILTRVGRFYESYFGQAIKVAELCGIKLARRVYKENKQKEKEAGKAKPNKVGDVQEHHPFAGFPVFLIDKYLKILVQECGETVVLVEEDPDGTKDDEKQIARQVGRIVTPGTLLDESWLNGQESRYLLAIAIAPRPVQAATTEHEHQDEIVVPVHLAYTDVATGDFFVKESDLSNIEDELVRISPREVVLDESWKTTWSETTKSSTSSFSHAADLLTLLRTLGVYVSFASPNKVQEDPSSLLPNFQPGETDLPRHSVSLLRHHLQYTLRDGLPVLDQPQDQQRSRYMQIDAATLSALEIRHAVRPGGLSPSAGVVDQRRLGPLSSQGTLASVIDRTNTNAGHRMLVRTLTGPSTDVKAIETRQELVQALVDHEELREEVQRVLRPMGDVMRIIQRFRAKRGDQHDLYTLKTWVDATVTIRTLVENVVDRSRERLSLNWMKGSAETIERLQKHANSFRNLDEVLSAISNAIDQIALYRPISTAQDADRDNDDDDDNSDVTVDEDLVQSSLSRATEASVSSPPVAAEASVPSLPAPSPPEDVESREQTEWWLLPTYSDEIGAVCKEYDRLEQAKEDMERQLRDELEAPTLYLTSGWKHGFVVMVGKVPRKTKPTTSELTARVRRDPRFVGVTIGGTNRSFAYAPWTALGNQTFELSQVRVRIQYQALRELVSKIVKSADLIRHNSDLVDELDLCASFAQTASEMRYVRPIVNDSTTLRINKGRHPAVESGLLSSTRMFTPNTTVMRESESNLHVITGPNQGGKSTLLRQTAVIAILAQAGSFVPADYAEIGVVDKVFSRVGARDDLFRDRSTFMLEMVETAAILKHATKRSLVIMDEIGRGTTLQAGVSIAYATLDYILSYIKCRTLFATHYHELAQMLGYEPSKAPSRGEPSSPMDIRPGVQFWCTDVDEVNGSFSYSYRLKPGVNYNSHAIKAAQLAGMPESFLKVADDTLAVLLKQQRKGKRKGK